MYEAEVNIQTESLKTIPKSIVAQLSEYRSRVEARTILPWGEHCTECVWPSCYKTCELFEPRIDGACRQFIGGVLRIPNPHGTTPYLQKITFRRWAKLWTLGTFQCKPLKTADLWERMNILVGSAARIVPAPAKIKQRLLGKISYVRRCQLSKQQDQVALKPDYFVIEIYNPTAKNVALTLSIRGNVKSARHTFQKLITAEPEFTRDKIPFEQISRAVDVNSSFDIELVPNDSENVTLYFGLLDFVKEREGSGTANPSVDDSRKCKCVVWDLDNTLWNGVLIEEGLDGIRLCDGVIDVIAELDRRGILQSIASKNNPDDAMAALKKFGIEGYFLHPQINWWPKSQSVSAIAKALNIGIDTLVLVDDQEFERAEVTSALPQVRVIDANHIQSIIEMQAFQVTVTEESRTRRLMYRQQEQRDALQAAYQGDYIRFLKENRMQVRLSPLTEVNLQRVYELAQRTNQMNFSGNRYSLDDLRQIAGNAALDTYVLRCSDRFGTYGIVGFAVVDQGEPRLLDLMFSCRIQAKKVEHGFLAWLLRNYLEGQDRDFLANYRKTPKNEPSGAVFRELGFDEVGIKEGVTSLRFKRNQKIPDEAIIEIAAEVDEV